MKELAKCFSAKNSKSWSTISNHRRRFTDI